MGMKLLKIVAVLLLVGFARARPQHSGAPIPTSKEEATKATQWKPVELTRQSSDNARGDSSIQPNDTQRHLKDLQYIDQSLRTVATQLLNVTNANEAINESNDNIGSKNNSTDDKINGPNKDKKKATTKSSEENEKENEESALIKQVNSEISSLESMGISFGRPMNSKFGYFENSHPGEAIAMTEEELEKEKSSTRLMTTYKNRPTTTGGISTWILLNPPSTTTMAPVVKTNNNELSTKQPNVEIRYTLKPIVTHGRIEIKNTKHELKTTSHTTSTASIEKQPSTKKPVTTVPKKTASISSSTEKIAETTSMMQKLDSIETTTAKVSRSTTASSWTKVKTTASVSSTVAGTTKKAQTPKSTPKPKVTTPKAIILGKLNGTSVKTSRPSQQNKPSKGSSSRRTTMRPEVMKNSNSSTAKVEKVTFKPVQMITTPKNKLESTDRPTFVTKIKASVLMDTQKTTLAPISVNSNVTTTSKPQFSGVVDLSEVPVKSKPIATSANNVSKVPSKKPVDDATKIEIEPIRTNAPILTIEKVEKNANKRNEIKIASDKDVNKMNTSIIDVQFDFNPELTKVKVETSSESRVTSTTDISTTTKRRRNTNKRKKNKIRRRKPSSTTPLAITTTITTAGSSSGIATTASTADLEELQTISTHPITADSSIQESKIEPDTKMSNSTSIKTKKKTPQKGISTQIYNFLSREVMPSFGVMSLVGLGLGLASYFLYPFGGTISRRNYEIEPNYKYNLDEYGGNYGQNEEDVLSQVFQGMTSYESKQPAVKDFDNNHYRYQNFDGTYENQATKRTDLRYPLLSSSPVYRSTENSVSGLMYRNTDFRYPEVHQTTPNHYESQKQHAEFVVGQELPGHRQFVVGNVPKEYPTFVEKISTLTTSNKKIAGVYQDSKESGQTQFERDIAQGLNYPPNSLNGHGYPTETQTLKTDDGYEEIEITPTAVAVEHGPRALKVKRSISRTALLGTLGDDQSSRRKRESVIQIIPTKRELEEDTKEENLSNEILDIIDSALPGSKYGKSQDNKEDNEVEDLLPSKKKHQQQSDTREQESTTNVTSSKSNSSPTKKEEESTDNSSKNDQNETNETTANSSTSSTSYSSTLTNDFGSTTEWKDIDVSTEGHENSTTAKPEEPSQGFGIFNIVKKVAEIKFRLGITLLKHASESFARYLGHVQKRINGEE